MREHFNRLMDSWLQENFWHYLWVPVIASIAMTEFIVVAMNLLLLGRVDEGYLLTGLVAAGVVSLAVCTVLFFLSDRLRANEERYRLLVDNAAIPVLIISLSGGEVLFANEKAAEYFGAHAADARGMHAADFWVHPEQRDAYVDAIRRCHRVSGYEAELRTRCGETKWVNLSANIIDFGAVPALFTVFSDITKHKQLEEALRQEEAKYRALFETANDGIFLQDATGFVDCNERGAAMYGLRRDQVIGHSAAEFCPERQPDGRLSADVAQEKIRAALQGQPQVFEWQPLRSDGTPFDVELTLNRIDMGGAAYLQAIVRDITERKKIERQFQREHAFNQKIIDSIPGAFYVIDAAGRFLMWNRNLEAVLGLTAAEIGDSSPLDFFDQRDRPRIEDAIRQVFETGESALEAVLVAKDRSCVPYYFNGFRFDVDGQPALIGIGIDISERKQAEAGLRLAASVFANSYEGIMITDADNRIVDVNPGFTRITGYAKDDAVGKDPKMLASGRQGPEFYAGMWQSLRESDFWRGEIWNRRKGGEVYAEMLSVSAVRDDAGRLQHHIGVFSDIDLLKKHEAELDRIAHYDTLTGVPNRRLLGDRLGQAIARAGRSGKPLAVCYLDLDGFKPINDRFGHAAGDRLLIEIAARLRGVLRADDTIARLGGDEFVLLLTDQNHPEECYAALDRVLATVAAPLPIDDGAAVSVSASIGVSFYPPDEPDADTLLRHADQAMYRAKEEGKNRYHLFGAQHGHRPSGTPGAR